jgi:hypothetical protein
MKTPDTTTTNKKLSRKRLSMIIMGIVTAIASLALLSDAQSATSYVSVNRVIGTSEITAADFSIPAAIAIAPKVMASVPWPF